MSIALFLRSFVFFILQCCSTVFFGILAVFLMPFPYKVRYYVITLWSKFIIYIAKVICGIKYEINGIEHLKTKAAILLSNHQSAWETLFLQTILPYQTWVLKKELLFIPFFGWGLWAIEPIAINRKRSSSLKQLVEQGKDKLEKDRWVVLFPEGSRMPAGKLGKFSKAGALLSIESKRPLVPMAHNAGKFWPRKAFLKQPGIIKVNIGPAITPEGKSIDELYKQSKDWIEEHLPR